MLIIYRFLINLVFLLSPIILIFRLIKKKEHKNRFKEKFCFFSKTRKKGKVLWFHGASVGEIQSIIPIIEKLEKKNDVNQILITSNTLSSSKIIEKFYFRKVVHQFFPIDTNYQSKKFLDFWKPSIAFFIDSEIWPNTIVNLESKKIPIVILNGRLTKKSFKRWNKLPNFSNFIFRKITFCLTASEISKIYFKKLGVKNIKFLGNLKFSQSENENLIKFEKLNNFINSKKIWCASSTHFNEEKLCGLVHKEVKKKHKNLLTIIIPRHVERTESIRDELKKLNLKIHTFEEKNKIKKDTDILLVNSYGKTKSIYNICKIIFLGGSLVNHGGQNPLEATRFNCRIMYGPNVDNFKDIYKYLAKLKLAHKVVNLSQLKNNLNNFLSKKNKSKNTEKKLKNIGNKILNNIYNEIMRMLKNEYK